MLVEMAEADEIDVDITNIKYTNDFENGEAVNIVPSGKNESTEYSFRIFDDDDDFPDDWEEVFFDDSEWDGFPTNSPNSVNCSLFALSFLNS